MESYDWALDAYRDGAVFTAFDIETTGLDPQKDQIVELGAVKFDNRGPISRFNVLINPGIPMPEAAGRVNHITDEMLAGQPSLEAVFPDFLRLVKDTVIIAHNAPFDCGFVNQKLKDSHEQAKRSGAFAAADSARNGQGSLLDGIDGPERGAGPWVPPFPALPNKIADTLVLSRRVFPGRNSYKLQDMAAFLQIQALSAHRAEDDARLCMEIFIGCAKKV
ncbi:DNA polymerase III subunit epsilon [Spirochaetia bacterium]|nr:DNA polymerase III subunit epsilon [Spirochaetia bacterium]